MLTAAQRSTKAVKPPEKSGNYKPITAYFQRLPIPKRPHKVNEKLPTSRERKPTTATSTSAASITQIKHNMAFKKEQVALMRDHVSSKKEHLTSRRDHSSKTDQLSDTTHQHPICTSPSDKLSRFEYIKKKTKKTSLSGSTTLAPSPTYKPSPSPVSKRSDPKLSTPSSKVRASTFIPLDLPRRSIDGSDKRRAIESKISSPTSKDYPMRPLTPVSPSTAMKLKSPPHSLARGAISPLSPRARSALPPRAKGASSPLSPNARGARSPHTLKASSPRPRHSSAAEDRGSDSPVKPVKRITFPDMSKSKASSLSDDVTSVPACRIPTPLKSVPIHTPLKSVPGPTPLKSVPSPTPLKLVPSPLKPVSITTPPSKPDVIELLSDSDSSGGKRVVPGTKRVRTSENVVVKRICLEEGSEHRNSVGSMKRPLSISSDEDGMLNCRSKRPLVVDLTTVPTRNVSVIDLTGENPRIRKKKRKKHSSDELAYTNPAARVKKAFHDRKRHSSDQWSRPHSLSSDPDLTPELPSLKSRFILPISAASNTCTSRKTLFESESPLDRTPPLHPVTLIDISDDEFPTPVLVKSEVVSPKTSKTQIRPKSLTSPKSNMVTSNAPSCTRTTDSSSKTVSPLNRPMPELPRKMVPSPKPRALFSSPKGCVSQHSKCKSQQASELLSPVSVRKELPSPAQRDLSSPKTTPSHGKSQQASAASKLSSPVSVTTSPRRDLPTPKTAQSVSHSPRGLSPSLKIASTKITSPKVVITKIHTESPQRLFKTPPSIARTSPKTKSPVKSADTLPPKATLSAKPILDEIPQTGADSKPCVAATPCPSKVKMDCLPPEVDKTAECHQKGHKVEATRGEGAARSGEHESPKAHGKGIKNVVEEAKSTVAIASNNSRLSKGEEGPAAALQGGLALDEGCKMDTDPSPAPWTDPSPAPRTDPSSAPRTDPSPAPPTSMKTEEEACKDAVTEHSCHDNSIRSKALGSFALSSVLGNGVNSRGWKDTPLHEVHLVMGERRLSSLVMTEEVRMLSAAQTSMISNRLDEHSRISSYHFCSLVDHLRLVTPSSRMLPGNLLKSFWEYLLKLKARGDFTSQPDMLFLCQQYLREFLVLHPPGQHGLVDAQYSSFLHALGQDGVGAFALWEHLESLIRTFPELGGFLVDLLVADLLAALKTERSAPPLFVGVFWPGSTGNHVTSPIRTLVENISGLVCSKTCSVEEASQLKDFMSLLYLVCTVCTDLTTELILACKRFPTSQHLLRFTSHLYSDSLLTQLQASLPQLKEACCMHASLVCPETGKLPGFVKPVKLAPTPLPPLQQRQRKKRKSTTSGKVASDSSLPSGSNVLESGVSPKSAGPSGKTTSDKSDVSAKSASSKSMQGSFVGQNSSKSENRPKSLSSQDGAHSRSSGGKSESPSSKVSPKTAKFAPMQNPSGISNPRRKSDPVVSSPKSAGIGFVRRGGASIRSQSVSSREGSSSSCSTSAIKGKGHSPHSKRKLFPGDISPPSSRPRAISFDSATRKHSEGQFSFHSPSTDHTPFYKKVKVQPLSSDSYAAKKKMVSPNKAMEGKCHEVMQQDKSVPRFLPSSIEDHLSFQRGSASHLRAKWESLAKRVGCTSHLERNGGNSSFSKRAAELVRARKSSSHSEKRRRSEPWSPSEVGLSKPSSFGPPSAAGQSSKNRPPSAAGQSSKNRPPPSFAKSRPFFTHSKKRQSLLPEEIDQHLLKFHKVRSPSP